VTFLITRPAGLHITPAGPRPNAGPKASSAVHAVLAGVAELGAGGALRLPPGCPCDWRNRRAAGVLERVVARFHPRRANLRGERVRLTTAHECMHACLSRMRLSL